MDSKALQQRLPLLWFDRALRRLGPLLPLPVVALRLASDVLVLRGEQHQLAGLQSGRLRGHYTETAVVYVGVLGCAPRGVLSPLRRCAPSHADVPAMSAAPAESLSCLATSGRFCWRMTELPQQKSQRLTFSCHSCRCGMGCCRPSQIYVQVACMGRLAARLRHVMAAVRGYHCLRSMPTSEHILAVASVVATLAAEHLCKCCPPLVL